jgi:hypothetical protein
VGLLQQEELHVPDPVQLQNVTLLPGDYEVTWTQMGSNVPLTILKDNKAVATVQASMVKQKGPYNTGTLELTKEPNGAEELTRIDFSKVAVILPPANPAVH